MSCHKDSTHQKRHHAPYSWLYEKGIYRTRSNSYVAHTIRFSNRDSLGVAPPLACRALTMVKFPTKNGDDGLQSTSSFIKNSPS